VSSSVEQFLKNDIPIRPFGAWKEKHCVLSEHQEPLTDTASPSQKTRIL